MSNLPPKPKGRLLLQRVLFGGVLGAGCGSAHHNQAPQVAPPPQPPQPLYDEDREMDSQLPDAGVPQSGNEGDFADPPPQVAPPDDYVDPPPQVAPRKDSDTKPPSPPPQVLPKESLRLPPNDKRTAPQVAFRPDPDRDSSPKKP